ncbi:SDR family NAD(P)-dependent oxidoreductase [Pseudonocardia spinosispora]|uniref:SDR family NAD(P)-dependent oxidoreductase n=1 Tax=Pseudonocardia spinosispora TaxID=103441 RepID=UPI00040358F5|nr:SDR family oxidoreductase [Pseudonocardia spinosispora]
MSSLEGKVAVITGGSSGIGLATAERFVAEGAYVFITGRRAPELATAAARIGRNVTTVQSDISDLADLDRLYDTVRTEKGGFDILVANAGVQELRPLAEATPEHVDKLVGVNLRGTLFTVQKALPLLRDGGSIVLISSTADRVGIPEYTVYSAAKAAQRSFTRSWAADLAGRNIRVNAVSPGPIDTPMIDDMMGSKEKGDAMRATFSEVLPMRRIGRPEEVAAAALFLASDEASFTTGADITVDGGQSQL